MTHNDSPHNFDPKHRILGAVIIVALAVIFVPMVLRERGAAPVAESPPSAPAPTSEAVENRVVITEVPPPGASVKPATSVPVPAPAAEPVKTASADAKPKAPESKPPAVATAKPAPTGSGWMVQVGTFANAANATRLEQKLRAEGQPVHAEQVQIQSGKAVRLRVGPFRDRAAALKAQARIQKEVGVKGVVLAYP